MQIVTRLSFWIVLIILMIGITSSTCSPSSSGSTNRDPSQSMTPGVKDMLAAPNQSRIRARVLHVEQSPQFGDRWNLDVEVLTVASIQGGTFTEPGQTVKAFTISQRVSLNPNDIITANAEYVGGPDSGWFRLTQIAVEP